jgi:hypothetical protein
MNKLKNLVLASILMLASFGANSTVITEWSYFNELLLVSTNSGYPNYVIGHCDSYISTCTLAPPNYSLPTPVNNDIYWAYNYAVQHGIRLTWGRCLSTNSVPPCIQ